MASKNDYEVLSIVLLVILCSPSDAQEYHDARGDPPLGIIPIRRAWAHWRAGVNHQALVNQKVQMVQAHRQVRAMMHATVLWRIRVGHISALRMYRDVRWQRQRFHRLWLTEILVTWRHNFKGHPAQEATSWDGQLPCVRITDILQKVSSGQRGNPGKEVEFIDSSGIRIKMSLKTFKQCSEADDFISAYREAAPIKAKSTREKLESMLSNKSVARFRSLASSADQSIASEDGSDYSLSLQGEPEDKLTLLIAERLGSESVAPRFRQAKQTGQKSRSQQRAVSQLQQSLDMLQRHENAASNEAHEKDIKKAEARSKEEYYEQKKQQKIEEELEALEALRSSSILLEKDALAGAMGEAQISADLQQMVAQSSSVNQAEVQQQIMTARLAAIEQSLVEMTAMNKSLLENNLKKTSHIRQYSSEAEMTLELLIDKVTHVHKENHVLVSASGERTCLVEGCCAEVPRNKKLCIRGHSTDVRQLICPWPGCHSPCDGSVQQQLIQPICLACSKPLIHSQQDPAVKLQLMKDLAELKEKDGKYDWKPKGPLSGIIKKDHAVSESECKWWRLLRLANDPDNFVIAPDAKTSNEALEELYATSKQVPVSKLLGEPVDFALSERALLSMFKGGKLGRDFSFQIFSLIQSTGCAMDKDFLKWDEAALKKQDKEPDWDHPQAGTQVIQFLDALTTLLRHSVASQIGDDHQLSRDVFAEAFRKEGPNKLRFTPKMVFEKHAAWFASFYTMGIAFVEESSYFDTLYGKHVLWGNPGTHLQAPKLVCR